MKVLWITNIPSPYRVDFFNELGKACDLTVLFEKSKSAERNKEWVSNNFDNFNGVFLKGKAINADMAICFSVLKFITNKDYDIIVVTNPASPTGILAILKMRFFGIKYWLEIDGAFVNTSNIMKNLIKRIIIKGSSKCFSTCENSHAYYKAFGAKSQTIVHYHFSSLVKADLQESPITKDEKETLRQTLQLENKKTAIAVGQFINRKGFDVLLNAWRLVDDDFNLIIIGGGELKSSYRETLNKYKLNNIIILDFMPKKELYNYYRASDIFVFPTREDIWGLVINEAMACGLPVITTDRCNAGIELIKTGENGYIVPVDDVNELAEKLNVFFNFNDKKQIEMGQKSLLIIEEYTIENMAKEHIDKLNIEFTNRNY